MKRICSVVMVLTLAAGIVAADGGFFPVHQGAANTADQRAIVVDHGDSQTIVLQTAYDGDASDFAWVIPVPSLIVAANGVGTTDPSIFGSLDWLTGPTAVTWRSSSAACGCGGSEGGAASDMRAGVTVWETLRIDSYDVAVLSTDDSGDLAAWLDDNGYGFPDGHADTLQYYVDRESFFVAFKIAPANGDGGSGGGAVPPIDLRPITLTFASDQLTFPIRISRVSTNRRVEVLLYVISRTRSMGANYATAEVAVPRTWRGEDFSGAYNAWFEDTLSGQGESALVVEYADYLPDYLADEPPLQQIIGDTAGPYFLTRLRTRLTPAQMAEDIIFAADGTGRFRVYISDGTAEIRGMFAGGMMLFAGLQAALFRSSRGRRGAWATAVFALMIAIL